MGRRDARAPRNRDGDRATIQTATDRLLAGTPLRSSGELTVTELIREAGLRRDLVDAHRDLVDAFKAQVKARDAVPETTQALAERHAQTQQELQTTKNDLGLLRAHGAVRFAGRVAGPPGGAQSRSRAGESRRSDRLSSHRAACSGSVCGFMPG